MRLEAVPLDDLARMAGAEKVGFAVAEIERVIADGVPGAVATFPKQVVPPVAMEHARPTFRVQPMPNGLPEPNPVHNNPFP